MNLIPIKSPLKNTTVTDDAILQLAFYNAAQANIISIVSTGKIVIANVAACKLLGYSKKDLLTKSRKNIFDIKEAGFKKMLRQRTKKGHSMAMVTAIKKTGKLVSCEITSAIFTDKDGIEKSITSITDISKKILEQKVIDKEKEKIVANNIVAANSIVAGDIVMAQEKSDARAAENSKWIKHIAKTSYDVMWDWDLITGQVYIGESIKEVFGYKFKNNSIHFSDLKKYFVPEEKNTVNKNFRIALASDARSWNDSYKIKRQDGTIASVNSRAAIVRDDNGKATRLIGAIQDITRLQELEGKLEQEIASTGKLLSEYNESFRLMFNSSSDILYDIDLLTDEILLSDGYQKEFGYPIVPHMKTADVWTRHLHPEDKEKVLQDYQRMLASQETGWKYSYRFLRVDGSVANILSSRIILRNSDGIAYRMIGSMQDISKQKVLEEKLAHEIKLKEKQIADAMQDAKEAERSDLGKELHDNVNQLLSASRLYLEMAKQGGPESEMYLGRSSEYTMNAIEEIRKLTKGLATDSIKDLGLCDAIDNLTTDTMQVNAVKIVCSLDTLIENRVNDNFKVNVFRIVQEQLNNILKHAHAKKIDISFSQTKKSVTLIVSDNGVGFDTTIQSKGIGIDNIKSRAIAFNGKADFISQPGKGCALTVIFAVTDKLLKHKEIE